MILQRRAYTFALGMFLSIALLGAAISVFCLDYDGDVYGAGEGEDSGSTSWSISIPTLTISGNISSSDTIECDDWTKITNLVIGDDVTSVAAGSLAKCTSLNGINAPYALKDSIQSMFEDTDYSKATITLREGSSVHVIMGEGTALNASICPNNCKSIVISSNVTSIPNNCFKNKKELETVVLPDSIVTFGNTPFYGCTALKDVYQKSSSIREGIVIPDGFTLKSNLFQGCTSIEKVILGNVGNLYNITNIFNNCSNLSSVELSEGITGLGSNMFANTSLGSIAFPSTLTGINFNAFKGCTSLETVDIGESKIVTYNVALNTYSPFEGCTSLKTRIVSADGGLLFEPVNDTGIYSVPDGVVKILPYSYRSAVNMTEIRFCPSVESVYNQAFSECKNLRTVSGMSEDLSVVYPANAARTPLFYGTEVDRDIILNDTIVFIPDIYQEYTIPSTVHKLNAGAFWGNAKLEKVTFEGSAESMSYMGEYLFRECTGLREVNLPGGLAYLYNGMFQGCSSLKSIDLTGISCIYAAAFQETALESVVIPMSVQTIGNNAFKKCESLKSVTFENPYVSFKTDDQKDAGYIFDGCTSLTDVILPTGLTSICNGMFRGCSSLSSISLPSTLQSIGQYAFMDTALTSVEVPEGVFTIQNGAFNGCTKLESLTLPSTLNDMSDAKNAFKNIGTGTVSGTDVCIRGCPDFSKITSSFPFNGAKINSLYIESVPTVNANTFKGSTIGKIVVSGGVTSAFATNPEGLKDKVENGFMNAYLKVGDSEIAGKIQLTNSTGTTLTIGDGVIALGSGLLKGKTYDSIVIAEGNGHFVYQDGMLFFKADSGSEGLAGAKLIYVKGGFEDVVVPEGVAEVAPYALNVYNVNSPLHSIVLPSSMKVLDVRSLRNVECILLSSTDSAPIFKMESTDPSPMRSGVYYKFGVEDSVIDSTVRQVNASSTVPGAFGGYYAEKDGRIYIFAVPQGSASITIEEIGGKDVVSILANKNYSDSVISVELGFSQSKAAIEPGADGKFVLENSEGTKKLTVSGLEVNRYGIVYEGDGYSISFSELDPSNVKMGTSVSFAIAVSDGYKASGSAPVVMAGDSRIEVVLQDGRYCGTVVMESDITISVTGIIPAKTFSVNFDSAGGNKMQSQTVISGYHAQFPGVPSKSGYSFLGWYQGDSPYDFGTGVDADLNLVAVWVGEDTGTVSVEVSADHGSIEIYDVNRDSIVENGSEILSGTKLRLTFVPMIGYELSSWTVKGTYDRIGADSIELIATSDIVAVAESTYTVSSFPYLETDTETPFGNDGYRMAWKLLGEDGGYNQMVYTPSIMGDYVYSWSGTYVYKISLFTGEIVKKADTGVQTNSLYYNMITVGNGFVLAGYSGQVYDSDLNEVFKLDYGTSGKDSGTVKELKAFYDKGYFYVFTKTNVYKFEAIDSDPSSNNVQTPIAVGETKYTHYISIYQGQSNLIFTDDFIIGIEVGARDLKSSERYLVTYDIDTLSPIDSYEFLGISGANLNTGYISYYDGTVYFNTYSPNSNMFGTASGAWNTISSIEIDDKGRFVPVTIHYYNIGTTSYPSSLVVVGDYGYLNTSTFFYVFDMKTMTLSGYLNSTMSHGNMSVSVQGDKVYAYIIPYTSTTDLYVFEHDQKTNVLTNVSMRGVIDVKEYCSQIVHFGPHGEILYYNDSGYLFCIAPEYTASFVSNGGSAVDDMKFTVADTIELPVLERDGCEFIGWYDNPSFDGTPVEQIQVGSVGDRTYYAKFIVTDRDRLIDSVKIKQFIDGGKSVIFSVEAGADAPEKTLVVTYSAYVDLPEGTVINPFLTDIVEMTEDEDVAIFSPKDVPKMESVTVTCCYEIDSVLYSTPYAKAEAPTVYAMVDLSIESGLTLSFNGTAVVAGETLRYGYYTVDVEGDDDGQYEVNGIVADGSNRLFYYGQPLTVVRAGA